jgi:hypothetical protein
MDNKLKINVDFQGNVADELMSFIVDTQEGKYTVEKPILTQVTYKRLAIEEQDYASFEDVEDNLILFGISN